MAIWSILQLSNHEFVVKFMQLSKFPPLQKIRTFASLQRVIRPSLPLLSPSAAPLIDDCASERHRWARLRKFIMEKSAAAPLPFSDARWSQVVCLHSISSNFLALRLTLPAHESCKWALGHLMNSISFEYSNILYSFWKDEKNYCGKKCFCPSSVPRRTMIASHLFAQYQSIS